MDRILIVLKKENGLRASSASALGLNTIIFKYVYLHMKQISGERLQDHWSSGFFFRLGFWSGSLFLIAAFPDLCLLLPFYSTLEIFMTIYIGCVCLSYESVLDLDYTNVKVIKVRTQI